MGSISLGNIWKQQKFNNSCAWDCFSMLLAKRKVDTTTFDLVGSSHVPYQLRLHSEENRLSAGMLIQEDNSVNAVLGRFGYQLISKRAPGISEYISLARETLLNKDAFVTSIKRPVNLPGRHAVVFAEFNKSSFVGLDPDCGLERTNIYDFSDVQELVTLTFSEDEFTSAVSGDDGFVPLLGTLSSSLPHEPEQTFLQEIFKKSERALEFYKSATSTLDFRTGESLPVIYSLLKPIVSDLRTAIEIRDRYLNQKSDIALFLREFENLILEFRKLIKNGESIPEQLKTGLDDYLKASYRILEEHLSYKTFSNQKATPIRT